MIGQGKFKSAQVCFDKVIDMNASELLDEDEDENNNQNKIPIVEVPLEYLMREEEALEPLDEIPLIPKKLTLDEIRELIEERDNSTLH